MELDGEPTSPAANHLFEVDDNGIKLKPEQKDMFHEFVAKLLSKTRPTNRYFISVNQSERTCHWRLQEINKADEIPE